MPDPFDILESKLKDLQARRVSLRATGDEGDDVAEELARIGAEERRILKEVNRLDQEVLKLEDYGIRIGKLFAALNAGGCIVVAGVLGAAMSSPSAAKFAPSLITPLAFFAGGLISICMLAHAFSLASDIYCPPGTYDKKTERRQYYFMEFIWNKAEALVPITFVISFTCFILGILKSFSSLSSIGASNLIAGS